MKLISALLVSAVLAAPAAAQELPAFRSDLYNANSPEGIFDVLVHVDGEAILYIKDTGIRYLLLSGAPLRDAGSNYRQPLPRAVYGSFNMEKKAGRGTVTLVEQPGPVNNHTAVIRINDRNSGPDFYHVQLHWTWNPSDPSRPPGGRFSRPLSSQRNDPGDYNRGRAGAFTFQGRVDDVAVLYIRSDQVREEDLNGRPIRGERFEFSQPLPSARLRAIELRDVAGRGEIELIEKPWEGNRYTAVVRISDPQRGDSRYRFTLIWER